ncbi:MAG: PorV/PorQ family protein [bacterium]
MCFIKKLFVIIGTVAVTNPLVAGGLTSAKYAGEFLNLGVGGRSLGMGGAYVAVARDVTSGYWNPAGLAFLDYPEIMLMHSSRFDNVVNYEFGSFGLPMGRKSSLGLSIIRVGVDNIKETKLIDPSMPLGAEVIDDNGQKVINKVQELRKFGATDYAFLITYSKRVSESFAYGGNIKLINRSIDKNSAWGIGFDIGFLFNPLSKLIVGINLQDVTSTLLAWDTGRRELITPSLKTGVTYPIALSFAGGQIQPALDFIIRFEDRGESAQAGIGPSSIDVNFGWEYQYHDVFAIRLGSSEVGQFTAGAGLHFPKLNIDYAFLQHNDLGDTHRISARLTLEEPKFLRKK